MIRARRFVLLLLAVVLAIWLAACSPAATSAPAQTQVVRTQVVNQVETQLAATPAPQGTSAATQLPRPTQTAAPQVTPASTATPSMEERIVEVEWPPQMRLGDSDLVRLSLLPFIDGFIITTEFEDHEALTRTVTVQPLAGYDLAAVARLDAVGFSQSPEGEQLQLLIAGQPATWRWTLKPLSPGQQRLALTLRLRWVPQAGSGKTQRETMLYDQGFTVQVISFLGLTTREVAMLGAAGLVVGGVLGLPLAAYALRPRLKRIQVLEPNPKLAIELPPGLDLSKTESDLLRALFKAYGRLVVAAEFRSGYSGARTFLALPVRPDGRADAYTIAKLGDRRGIEREYANFETFVKDTLPPVTARIQTTPVTTTAPRSEAPFAQRAALRYTFIGEPGQSPTSLRQALLANPDPALLDKLFATFGPNWWMQRKPYTFQLAAEYDRLLPTHFVLEPVAAPTSGARVLDGRTPPSGVQLEAGDVVRLANWRAVEMRPDGRSLALMGEAAPGQPPLRAHWLGASLPRDPIARVAGTRASLLRDWTAGFDRHGLPDPLPRLPALLAETVSGSQSTIHGDLNLENVLVGPGGFVWLIDFAQTREGHPLFDFAHLEAAILSQIISPAVADDADFLSLIAAGSHPLLRALHTMAGRCLFNTAQPREYQLALTVACLGALKFANLDPGQKHRLYLAAAYLAQTL